MARLTGAFIQKNDADMQEWYKTSDSSRLGKPDERVIYEILNL